MSQASKEVDSKQQDKKDSKDTQIAAMINQVIEILDSVKKKAQQLYDEKCPSSVKSSMQNAASLAATTLNKTKACAQNMADKKSSARKEDKKQSD